jgi:hypothetical protein
MAMIFTLVSILKETLEETLLSTEAKAKESQRIASEKEKQRLRDEVEDQIGKTLRRTPVTYELFLEWKGRFDAWKVEQAKRGVDVENVRGRNREKERREENRLTGREVFERMKAETEEGFEEGEEDGLVGRQREDDVGVVAREMRELKVGE